MAICLRCKTETYVTHRATGLCPQCAALLEMGELLQDERAPDDPDQTAASATALFPRTRGISDGANLNTLLLGIIAAVALGAVIVWWSNQPTAAERRQAEHERTLSTLNDLLDRIDVTNKLLGR